MTDKPNYGKNPNAAEPEKEKVRVIPIEYIDEFPNHPFHVNDDEEMEKLMASIKEIGLQTPIVARIKEDGRYEIVSGHRRLYAMKKLGMTQISAIVRDMTRDEAIIAMVDSNLQREHILPSEKAAAYCKPGMNNADVFMSVAYALAHADMAADVDDYVPGEHEFEAECAAYTLCRKHGLPADPMMPKSIPEGFRTMKPAEIRKCLDEGHAAMKHLCSTMYKSLGRSKENAQDERKPAGFGQRDTFRPREQKRGGDAR